MCHPAMRRPFNCKTGSSSAVGVFFDNAEDHRASRLRPIHAKAMPVLLTTAEEWDTCLTGPVDEAAALQRPSADRNSN
jgi:hypothetical protein